MGSTSDWGIMSAACETLEELGIEYEKRVISAHRTPHLMFEYATTARERGIGAIIAGAGGAAHVAGVTAALTTVPVIGVPIKTSALGGLDSLLSIVQMPGGIPVSTTAINGAKNAAQKGGQWIWVKIKERCVRKRKPVPVTRRRRDQRRNIRI